MNGLQRRRAGGHRFLGGIGGTRSLHHRYITSNAPPLTLTSESLTATLLPPRSMVMPLESRVTLLLLESLMVIEPAPSSSRILCPDLVTMVLTPAAASEGISPLRQ